MNRAHYSNYLTITNVGNLVPQGTTTRNGTAQYRVQVTGKCVLGREFIEGDGYQDIIREVDINFVDITERQGRALSVNCEIYINGGNIYSYNSKIGFPASIAEPIAALNPEYKGAEKGVVSATQVAEGLAHAIGAQHLAVLQQIIPSIRRRMAIIVKPFDWAIMAHPGQIENAQAAPEFEIDQVVAE